MQQKRYCHTTTFGIVTNLQLCSYVTAKSLWEELLAKEDRLEKSRILERQVVILDLLGLSVSQLLGQQIDEPDNTGKTPPLERLFEGFKTKYSIRSKGIKKRFNEFRKYYHACKHFGPKKYEIIDNLDKEKMEDFVELTKEIWNLVISGGNQSGEIEFKDIEETAREVNAAEKEEEVMTEKEAEMRQ